MNEQPNHDLYTVTEAAKLLRIGRSTLYRHINSGDVPYRIMGHGAIRMSEADVVTTRSWLDQRDRPIFVHSPGRAA